jgi:Domain of unknown function (DUF4476)
MRYLFTLIIGCLFTLPTFAQDAQTVTLVFVTPANDNYKNYEAVIDDVSYYSENTPSANSQGTAALPSGRNTIFLNNFQAGRHTIQVYSLRNGSNDERADNTPIYSSTFNVREGFDTKIAIRGNGQVQFSERQGAMNGSTGNTLKRDADLNNSNSTTTDNNAQGGSPGKVDNINDANDRQAPATQPDNETYQDQNTNGTKRSATKRGDGAPNYDSENNVNGQSSNSNNIGRNNNNVDDGDVRQRNDNPDRDNNDRDLSTGNAKRNSRINSNPPMADYQFNYLYETISKQWLPGQKMKNLSNEFENSGDNFTTQQAKKLVELVTEEGNRLQLAKSSYHTITDPENFSAMYDVLRLESNKEELDKFVRDFQN